MELAPLEDEIVGETKSTVLLLLGTVGAVLLLACTNVGGLLLAQASVRQREMAVRSALGASRFRLAKQLFAESTLLAFVGGLAELVIAAAFVDLLVAWQPEGIPRMAEAVHDSRALAYSFLITALAGLLTGITPAFQGAVSQPSILLRGGSSTDGRNRRRWRSLLVIAEITVAMMLMVGAGLLIRSFDRIMGVDPGFNPENILVARVRLDGDVYGGKGHVYYRELLEQLRALPGVVSAGAITGLPMSRVGPDFDRPYWREGEPRPVGGGSGVMIRMPTTDYFRTMGIPLLAGRDFTEHDDRDSPRVIIVNESLAKEAWPRENPLGGRLIIDYQNGPYPYEVIGVVPDQHYYGLKSEPRPSVFIHHGQNAYLPMNIVLRTTDDPSLLAGTVRSTVLATDPAQPAHSIVTMDELLQGWIARDRFSVLIMSSLAGAAFLLAIVGVYGVVALGVSQRRAEIGIRRAFGASDGDILNLVLQKGIAMAAAGVGCGLVGALLLSQMMSSLLFQVSPTDSVTLGLAGLLLTTVVLIACYVPARRAVALDPQRTLRLD